MDIRLALMTGIDVPIPECQIAVHQPSIEEIALMGENDFFKAVQCLTINKSMFIKDEIVPEDINNFQIFMTIMGEKETIDKKEAVKQLFVLIFPKYNVMFTPRSLIFAMEGHQTIIDENNFEFLQDILKKIFCASTGPMDQQAFNPANGQARAIADKLMRGRQRVAEQSGSANTSIFSQYLSAMSIGLHMDINVLTKYTMYQIYDMVERYSLYTSWDIDIRSRLTGAKPGKEAENWMKNIHT